MPLFTAARYKAPETLCPVSDSSIPTLTFHISAGRSAIPYHTRGAIKPQVQRLSLRRSVEQKCSLGGASGPPTLPKSPVELSVSDRLRAAHSAGVGCCRSLPPFELKTYILYLSRRQMPPLPSRGLHPPHKLPNYYESPAPCLFTLYTPCLTLLTLFHSDPILSTIRCGPFRK